MGAPVKTLFEFLGVTLKAYFEAVNDNAEKTREDEELDYDQEEFEQFAEQERKKNFWKDVSIKGNKILIVLTVFKVYKVEFQKKNMPACLVL